MKVIVLKYTTEHLDDIRPFFFFLIYCVLNMFFVLFFPPPFFFAIRIYKLCEIQKINNLTEGEERFVAIASILQSTEKNIKNHANLLYIYIFFLKRGA